MLAVIAGPGGVGKDTVAQTLCAEDPRFVVSRSWTTRARRKGELADSYRFVDQATFEARRDRGGFLEWAEYHGNLYGTPMPASSESRVLLLVIEVQGARKVLELYPDTPVVLLVPPSDAELRLRLRERGDGEADVERRAQAAATEIEQGKRLGNVEVVVNDDLTRAVAEVRRILEGRLSGGTAPPPL